MELFIAMEAVSMAPTGQEVGYDFIDSSFPTLHFRLLSVANPSLLPNPHAAHRPVLAT